MPMDKIYTFFYLRETYQDESAESILLSTRGLGENVEMTKDENIDCSPSEFVLKRILDFAKSYDVLKSASTGYVELNLN